MAVVVTAVSAFFILLALVSGRLRGTVVSTPMLAMAAGLLLGPGLGVLPTTLESGVVLGLAQLTLAIVLFVDASRVDLRHAAVNGGIPARMLLLGLPLVVLVGTATGAWVLGLPAAAAFVLAVVLAPTDAALGQTVLTDERLPLRVRQAINVESGLNDGLAAPLLAVALAVATEAPGATEDIAREILRVIGIGAAVGVAMGAGIAWALRSVGWRSLEPALRQVGVAAVPLAIWGAATALGGNGFVATFVAGVAFAAVLDEAHELVEFAEDVGELTSLLTFIVFGAVFLRPSLDALSLAAAVYVVLQLTLVRMLPVAASLVGMRLRVPTVAMLGWFGPRGLATVVFGLEVFELYEEGEFPLGEELFGVASLAVVVSVVAHGMSAAPLVGRYVGWLDRSSPAGADRAATPEFVPVEDVPTRRSRM